MDEAAFSIDFAAAYTIIAALFVCVFFAAANTISPAFTTSYSNELKPIAWQVGDELLKSRGIPDDWYMGPASALNATAVGLSNGNFGVLSAYKIEGLYLFNASALKKRLGLEEEEEDYGVRIEIRSLDGAIGRVFGYPLPPDTKNVCRSVRLAIIEEPDGTSREVAITVYLWRKNVGAA